MTLTTNNIVRDIKAEGMLHQRFEQPSAIRESLGYVDL
jgi:hypothetical protein